MTKTTELSPEELFLKHREFMQETATILCVRDGLGEQVAEEFVSWMMERIVDSDYALFRKFRGDSQIRTYLTTCIKRLLLDYRNHRWGKWSPSAAARRMGTTAVRLETLVYRDGYAVQQAIDLLRENEGREIDDERAAEILARLPSRYPRRFVGEQQVPGVDRPESVEARLRDAERQRLAEAAEAAMNEAMADMSEEDRLIMRLRFEEGLMVARISRRLHLDQKRLYRRISRLLEQLRSALEARDLDLGEISRLFGWTKLEMEIAFDDDEEA